MIGSYCRKNWFTSCSPTLLEELSYRLCATTNIEHRAGVAPAYHFSTVTAMGETASIAVEYHSNEVTTVPTVPMSMIDLIWSASKIKNTASGANRIAALAPIVYSISEGNRLFWVLSGAIHHIGGFEKR